MWSLKMNNHRVLKQARLAVVWTRLKTTTTGYKNSSVTKVKTSNPNGWIVLASSSTASMSTRSPSLHLSQEDAPDSINKTNESPDTTLFRTIYKQKVWKPILNKNINLKKKKTMIWISEVQVAYVKRFKYL